MNIKLYIGIEKYNYLLYKNVKDFTYTGSFGSSTGRFRQVIIHNMIKL